MIIPLWLDITFLFSLFSCFPPTPCSPFDLPAIANLQIRQEDILNFEIGKHWRPNSPSTSGWQDTLTPRHGPRHHPRDYRNRHLSQSLDFIVSDIVHEVKEQQVAAGMPLKIDKEWIMREQISEDGYIIEPKYIYSPNALGPFFNKLPQELRDMIFADCLASGYPQFMAASRAMKTEGLGQISQEGVLRMTFGITVRMNLGPCTVTSTPKWPQLTEDISNKIKHLCVLIKGVRRHFRRFWSNVDVEILRQFGGSEIPRKSCKILIDLQKGMSIMSTRLFVVLKTFSGFEDVQLRLLTGLKFPHEYSEMKMKRLNNLYSVCGSILSPALGPRLMGKDEEGLFMSFHPQKLQVGLSTASPGMTALAL